MSCSLVLNGFHLNLYTLILSIDSELKILINCITKLSSFHFNGHIIFSILLRSDLKVKTTLYRYNT